MKRFSAAESRIEFIDRIRTILTSRGLTVSKVSQASRNLYGRWSSYFIPHNFYSALAKEGFTPSLQQLCALSHITRYRLQDWLLVFGFNLDRISRLQATLPTKRTLKIDTGLEDCLSWIRWIEPRAAQTPASGIGPLARLFSMGTYRRAGYASSQGEALVLIKVGYQDTYAYPELYPGSIVVAKRISENPIPRLEIGKTSARQYLVEYSNGLICCRLHRVSRHRIILFSKQLPYPHLELDSGKLQVLATLEYEVRTLNGNKRPEVPQHNVTPARSIQEERRLGEQLRAARHRAGLSLREASVGSAEVARLLGDSRYFLASGSLSEYESLDAPTRRIHKLVSLSILYGFPFLTFLKHVGFADGLNGGEAMPDELVPRAIPSGLNPRIEPTPPTTPSDWNDPILSRSIAPHLVNEGWGAVVGLPRPGLHDLFWLGSTAENVSPHLSDGVIGVINRHRKKLLFCRAKPAWQQPLYLILHRDGSYECACCSRERGVLVIRPCSADIKPPRRFESGLDAEVIGRFVSVVRRLP